MASHASEEHAQANPATPFLELAPPAPAARGTPVSNASTTDYEPFMFAGNPFGHVHWLRTESGGEGVLLSGFWMHAPADLPY